MELLERSDYLSLMQKTFNEASAGEGHCILVSGEAGIGKTSLVRAFCKKVSNRCTVYQGTCDELFTPRPLGPILDIIWQMQKPTPENAVSISDRSWLFTRFLSELINKQQTIVLVIEDVHWADEATFDFIKFLGRRITGLHCLFILTYRDDEINMNHPLRIVLGQLQHDSFTRLQLKPLSKQVVEEMSSERGYNGEDVYSISGGNPFYVSEILASYSIGVPDNIKDSVLSSFNRLDEKTKEIWEILSVLPTGFEIKYLEKMEPAYAQAIHNCVDLKILIPKAGIISFKHELYRRTIESSLSPLIRKEINKRILDLMLESFEQHHATERIIHHAKNANENEIVVKYAPVAAKQASSLGAHIEASKLYLTAIEYYQGNDTDILNPFYESYAYECYLTNQIREAIIYTTKSMKIWNEKSDVEKKGNCLRFLSRLWWLNGNRKKAEEYATQAIDVLADQPVSRAKAMAFSNMSQLKMHADKNEESILLAEMAIAFAKELGDQETLAHALNNVGFVQMRNQSTRQKGIELAQQSLDIALKNSYQEHAARAYANLAGSAVKMKDYGFAKKILDEGLYYCEETDLDTYPVYLMACKARLNLETGNWNEASHLIENLIKNENQPPIVRIEVLVVAATLKMRKGEMDLLPLLVEAKEKAFETMEPQRIIPTMIALFEYEWLTGTTMVVQNEIDLAITMKEHIRNIYERSEFAFWLSKAKKQKLTMNDIYDGYRVESVSDVINAANLWEQLGCPYEQALILFEGNDDNKKQAIEIMRKLGAEAIYEKMKFEMRASGIKNIPRGIRKSTQANPANLTDRELDVLQLLKEGLQNKEIAARLFISPKTVDHHISSIFFKLDVNSRAKAVQEAIHLDVIKY